MPTPEGDDRAERTIEERFFHAATSLVPFIASQCGAETDVRIVLDDDLAAEFCECGEDEDWQGFGYGMSRLTIGGELVCVEYIGDDPAGCDWIFRDDVDPKAAVFQINVYNMILNGVAQSTIVTIGHVLRG